MNSSLQTILSVAAMSLAITQAHAELVISEPTQKYQVALSTNQVNLLLAPSETSIIKLMQVMHIDDQITAIIDGQQAAIDVITTQTDNADKPNAGDKLNKRQRELQNKIQGILGQYTKVLSDGISESTDQEQMTQAYISAARTYYTQAEVDVQINFYETPIGQSILAKQPQVTAAFLQQSLPKDMNLENTKEQFENLIPQMRQIIKDIL